MNIFALEVDNGHFSVALQTKKNLSIKTFQCSISEELSKKIDDFISEHNGTLNNIDYFIINTGPSSFSALRSALATIYGISITLNKNVYGFSNLNVLAYMSKKKEITISEIFYNTEYSQSFYDNVPIDTIQKNKITENHSKHLMKSTVDSLVFLANEMITTNKIEQYKNPELVY